MASEILRLCMEKGFLLDKDMLNFLSELNEKGAKEVIDAMGDLGFVERVITKKFFEDNFLKIKAILMKDLQEDEIEAFFSGVGYSKEETEKFEEDKKEAPPSGKIKILSAPAFPQKKIEVKDFINHFRVRFESLKRILESSNLENLSSIRKISEGRGSYTIIAMVVEKRVTKNRNLLITVEDLTGTSVVLVNQNKKDLFRKAQDLLLDDIVAFEVTGSREMLFANEIVFPEAFLGEKRYGEVEECIAFISDLHVGSKMFLEDKLLRFVKWLNGEEGDESQKSLAKKVRYLLINGDTVDGVSVYPGQENDLMIDGLRRQYEKFAEILKLVRKDVKIIISPGQHDASWIGEPQPIIGEEWAPELYKMENVTLLPNPSLIEIDGGFKILIYHGASMHGIIEEIQDIRIHHGHDSPTRVVKEMIKRRHLAPIHGVMDYIPCEKKDPMVIEIVPDIITTGDQHRAEISSCNNILLIASSCWQAITPFEERVGNNPDPCKVPLFNLRTREIKILDFSGEDVK